MEEYRYTLTAKNPTNGRTEKADCPACRSRGRFVRYWDNRLSTWADGRFGVCDRVNSCGYHCEPWKENQHTGGYYLKPTPAPAPAAKPLQVETIPLDSLYWEQRNAAHPHTLGAWLAGLFGADVAASVLMEYCVTSTEDGRTVYWQRDGAGAFTTARVIAYQPNGHRDKAKPEYWAHNVAARRGIVPRDYQPNKHLFGVHLLKPQCKVGIVESEKSALLAACYARRYGGFNGFVFVATGGSNFIETTTANDGGLLAGCDVVLFPDSDTAGRKWIEKARAHGWKVNDTAHRHDPAANGGDGSGYDFGDLIFDTVSGERAARTANEARAKQESSAPADTARSESEVREQRTRSGEEAARIAREPRANHEGSAAAFLLSIGFPAGWKPTAKTYGLPF